MAIHVFSFLIPNITTIKKELISYFCGIVHSHVKSQYEELQCGCKTAWSNTIMQVIPILAVPTSLLVISTVAVMYTSSSLHVWV